MKFFFLISIFFLFCNLEAADFEKSEQSVLDKKHHLEWQDNRDAKEDIWKLSVGYCKQLKLNSHDDWRLPSKEEISRLFKLENAKQKFTYLEENLYWSIDEDKSDTFNAITVFSGNGFQSSSDKCEKNVILCVRDY